MTACAFALVLGAIGVESRRRMLAVDRDVAPVIAGRADAPIRTRTSPLTHVAWVGGVTIAVEALCSGRPQLVAAVPALFVALAGSARRVAGFAVTGEGLEIRYATGANVMLAWDGLEQLEAARTPIGGWSIRRRDGPPVTLMPSDLIGNERVLQEAIRRGYLTRVGRRRWSRGSTTSGGTGTDAEELSGRPGSPSCSDGPGSGRNTCRAAAP